MSDLAIFALLIAWVFGFAVICLLLVKGAADALEREVDGEVLAEVERLRRMQSTRERETCTAGVDPSKTQVAAHRIEKS